MREPPATDVRKIGFNDYVQYGSRSFHVQTEVLGRPRIIVQSTVLEKGTVRFVDSQPCPLRLREPERIRAMAEAQHEKVLRMVQRGEVE